MSRLISERSFDDGRDRWRAIELSPSPALRAHIGSYGWWRETTESFDTRQELASIDGTLIVNLNGILEIVDADGERIHLRPGEGFIAGLARGTSFSRSNGTMEGVHVRAPLHTLARVAGLPPAELTNRAISLSELPALQALGLGEQLATAGSDAERWTRLDGVLEARLMSPCPYTSAAVWIASALAAGRRVETLAKDLGWTRKRLAKIFFDAYGLHPRAYAALARFQRFTEALISAPHLSLAAIALDAGYADQAHLTRETRRHARVTPSQLRRQLLPEGGGVRG